MRQQGPLRVLIIDDAVVFRRALGAALAACGDLNAVGTSGVHEEVRRHLLQLHPEVILLDLDLQTNDALRLLTRLRKYYPVPVIVYGDGYGAPPDRGLRATAIGALEILSRPRRSKGAEFEAFVHEIAQRCQTAVASARPVPPAPRATVGGASFSAEGLNPVQHVVVLGASTGGTEAIAAFLGSTPADFPPIVIVQHMPSGFTAAFATRLNALSATRVTEAVDGQPLHVGCAVVARGDTHLVLRRAGAGWIVRYTDQTPVNRHCPSVDVLFESAAYAAGARAIGVLLTGMGADGAKGMVALNRAGALTLAQDKASCVVYGMPKEAVTLGAVQVSGPPHELPAKIVRALAARKGHTAGRAVNTEYRI
jgi:two-component system chemotaxis response regulator CheB